ncbi:MAG: extracellular solute-binding protein [Clostridia bacterium]|nr:extracellular solute-binding protein [Clostridia bacterium]
MKHPKLTKVLAFFLAVLVLIGPGAVVSTASEGSLGGGTMNSLTDLLSAIKYTEYLEKYAAVANGTETVTIEGDALLQYAEDITTAYSDVYLEKDGVYVTDADGNKIPKFVKDKASITTQGQIAIVQEKDGKTGLYLPNNGVVGWSFDVPAEGMYNVIFNYLANDASTGEESKTTSIERSLYINGRVPYYEARFISLTKVWVDDPSTFNKDADGNVIYKEDATGNKVPNFHTDINGNEIKSDKMQAPEWRTFNCMDSTGYVTTPLLFYFKEGTNTLALEAQREAMFVSSIKLAPPTELPTYEEYYEKYVAQGAKDYTGEPVRIQAEYPSATSENTIYATNDRTSYITQPQDAANILMNTIGGDGGEKWQTLGQWVRYSIEVPESGFYNIVLRFKQSVLEGTFSSRTLRVRLAGETEATVPFYEAYYLQFNYSDDWQVGGLNAGNPELTFRVYLEKGTNDIELEASFGNMSDILRRVNTSLQTINDIYIKILRITGATPDNNRDYGFYDIMPDDCDELRVQAKELQAISDMFVEITGTAGSHAKTLETVSMLLEKMGSHEDNIARNLSNLKEKLGTLGTWLQTSMSQPLQIDYIQIQNPETDEDDFPKAVENFFQALWYEISMFFVSFSNDYDTLGATEIVKEENKITVWTTLGRDQAQIIRNLITNGYNSKTEGYSVVLELVAGGSLIPSILAGVGPDISMGHGSGDVINWAIRSAVVPIDEMEGYDEVTTWFSDAATIPLTLRELYWAEDVTDEEKATAYKFSTVDYQAYEDYNKTCPRGEELTLGQYAYALARSKGYYSALYTDPADDKEYYYKESVYGLPETQSFSMLFYRADIFLDLGIEAPKTWQELLTIVPTLQKNKMEVAFPTSGGGLNLFLYQMGGELYADDGREIAIDSNLGLEAFEYLCQFFEQYRFPISYDFSNRFRSGEIPIGIMDYGTYTQLSVYATEIKGLWQFVPLPAYTIYDDKTGDIVYQNNDSVSGVSAIIMVKNDERNEAKTKTAWEFMKWYVSAETQTEYASELTALLGTVSKHQTANIEALESLPWTTTEKNNLMAQFENLAAIPEYPGSYIIGRYVNFAFLAVYNENADAADSLQSYIIEINKELTRKRQEFGMAYYEISYSAGDASDE